MATRGRSERRSAGAALRKLVRRAVLLCGLAALLGGIGWSAASLAGADPELPVAASPLLPVGAPAGQCLSVQARESLERESCVQRTYRELLAGWLELDDAVRRLRGCSAVGAELAAALERFDALRIEERRARLAFGLPVGVEPSTSGAAVTPELPAPSPAAVARLRRAGITPLGIAPGDRAALERLRRSPSLRSDVREVFGERTGEALGRLLDGSGAGEPIAALAFGGTVLVPAVGGSAAGHEAPRFLARAEHTDDVLAALDRLEAARDSYLATAGYSYRLTGSIGRFVATLRGESDTGADAAVRAERDRHALLAELESLERETGLDPALVAVARERVRSALALSRACEAAAQRRARWVSTGAGVVTGLTGGAAVVVASGATGTLLGGVTIAAALQAAGGAYLSYRSELAAASAVEQPVREPPLPVDPERELFERHARAEHAARGLPENGWHESRENWEAGEWEEMEGAGEGEGEELEGPADHTAPEPPVNTIPAELPPPLEEEALELPPMLTALRLGELPRLTLAEAQERIDEFLALDAGARTALAERAEPTELATSRELIDEALAALALWVEHRELSPGFGEFFLRAEVEDLPRSRRERALQEARERWLRDRAMYRQSGNLDQLRVRVAERLVVHCRGGDARGDLILQACTDPTALTLVVIAALRDAALAVPGTNVLGVQANGADFHPVLYDSARHEVRSLLTGEAGEGVTAPIYHPATFYYGFLVENGLRPELDVEEHLLIAGADRGVASAVAECKPRSRGFFARLADWMRSLLGRQIPSRRGAACGAEDGMPARSDGAEQRRAASGGSGVQISIPRPRIPQPSGGSGPPGGGRAGGGGGGTGSEDGSAGGGAAGKGGEGVGNAAAGAENGSAADARATAASPEGSTSAEGAVATGNGGNGEGQGEGEGKGEGAAGATGGEGERGAAGEGSGGSGVGMANGEGGRYVPGATVDLIRVARESEGRAMAAREEGSLPVRGWRLRENHSFTPPAVRVLYADNEHALARFRPEDRFITMSPSLVEAQRRMFEADSFRIYPVETECAASGLPPRRVFRRATGVGDTYRYVYCDQDESMVAFRTREDARSYARLGAPDRPLLLARFASERIQCFEGSEEIRTIHAFLRDPEIIRTLPVAELDSLVNAAVELLWFQETLEATLFLSMSELEGSSLRGYYYDLNRQVAQSPFLVELVAAVYRFNQRLTSDPLRSLAWVNALPPEHRRRFFSLYYTLGGPMHWPTRWESLHRRYAEGRPSAPIRPVRHDEPSLDFLQIMSDPTRVRIDWSAEEQERRPSIHDRTEREGVERTREPRALASDARDPERQETLERRRGGTRGLGRAGEGDGLGPERGRRPLQLLRIRMVPDEGEPDAVAMPEHNPTRPGGTSGERKVQERSASRQEPVLWLPPETFIDAVLSAWDPPRVRPAESRRVPPAVRFTPRLREIFLREPDEDNVYEARLANAMSVLATGGWLGYTEVRAAMGGEYQGVRAYEVGTYAAEYARNAAIVDQDQVRGPNYFTRTGIPLPADLVGRIRHGFSRHGTGSFDLRVVGAPADEPFPPVSEVAAEGVEARAELLRALELIAREARGPRPAR